MAIDEALVCLTTVADGEEAARLAEALVDERLAACVNELPVRSTYRWQGNVEHADERLLVVKTSKRCFERLRMRIRELSSYEVPEIVALAAQAIDTDYLAWLLAGVDNAASNDGR